MARKSNYWYVLVITDDGPVFVTDILKAKQAAEHDKCKPPMELDKVTAQDLAIGLSMNFTPAYAICNPFPIDAQPFRYDLGHLEWKAASKAKTKGTTNA